MILRAVLAQDAAALAELHARAFAAAWGAEEIVDLLGGPGGFGLLVELASGVIGGFILCRALVGEAEVLTLAVDPRNQGQGLGRALLLVALAMAETAGAKLMFLEVAADNVAAIALYERAGFARIGLRRGYYAHGRNAPIDALVYRLTLTG